MRGGRLAGRRILVVEDDLVLRRGIVHRLRSEGASAEAVESGEEAVELVVAGGSFDVLLVDLELPGMDGAECAHLVRASHRIVRAGTVGAIVGMSGNLDRLVAQRDGFDATVAKPFSWTALVDDLAHLSLARKPKPDLG